VEFEGNIRNDLRISLFLRLKTLVAAASFWLLFLSCRRKSNWLEGIRVKTAKDGSALQGIKLEATCIFKLQTPPTAQNARRASATNPKPVSPHPTPKSYP
jgi:hypothetical protein